MVTKTETGPIKLVQPNHTYFAGTKQIKYHNITQIVMYSEEYSRRRHWSQREPGEQGSKDGAVVRALASHQCGQGPMFNSGTVLYSVSGLSLLLVLVLALMVFSPFHKNQHSKFQFDQDRGPGFNSGPMSYVG